MPLVKYFAIDSKNASALVYHFIKSSELHPVEYYLFTKAIESLDKCVDASYLFTNFSPDQRFVPNNVVLVSFFVRKLEKSFNGELFYQVSSDKDGAEIHK